MYAIRSYYEGLEPYFDSEALKHGYRTASDEIVKIPAQFNQAEEFISYNFV